MTLQRPLVADLCNGGLLQRQEAQFEGSERLLLLLYVVQSAGEQSLQAANEVLEPAKHQGLEGGEHEPTLYIFIIHDLPYRDSL